MRAHEFITEQDARTMILWHGGNLTARPDNLELIAQKKGRFEFGSGLYATTNWDTAQKYAKGSRKLYKITLQQGNDANTTRISTDAVLQFVNQFVPKAKREDVTERIQRRSKDGEILADTFSNIILNSEAIRPANTKDMSEFLVSQGVDYLSVPNAFGWHEQMFVIYNLRKVTNIQQITSKDKIDQYDLPTEFTEDAMINSGQGSPLSKRPDPDQQKRTQARKNVENLTDDH